jgi:UDP-GlcNAc:undecaprenyl-phosphate GlcNAc-1-phosphate transferase
MPGNPLDWTFHYAASFLVALAATLLVTRLFRDRFAARLGLVELPGPGSEREWPVAKVGGVAMCVAIAVIGVAATALSPLPTMHPDEARALIPVLLGAFAMCGVGLWDDLRDMSPGRKLVLQILIASVVWYAGARFGSFHFPGTGLIELSPFASLVFTVFWFVAITNAFNLVDGADGVAGGAALTATVAMFVVALVLGQPLAAQVLVVVAAALLGFLFFNFPPATVFMGDAGSLSIGFLLAGVGLVSSTKATTVAAIAIPVVSLGLPILDTGLAIIRRVLRGEGVHKRDLGHIHHRLQKLGHSPRQVALILYAACGTLALASMVFLSPDLRAIGLVMLVTGVITLLAVQRLRIPELMELRRLMDQALRQREVIARSVAIREAAAGVERLAHWEEVLHILTNAFGMTEFGRVEVRLANASSTSRQPASPLAQDLVWAWSAEEAVTDDADVAHPEYELRVPLNDPIDGTALGELTVARKVRGDLAADLQLITEALLPEMAKAIRRLDVIQRHTEMGVPTRYAIENDRRPLRAS